MKTIILAAGKGTRLKALAKDMPKPMMKIGGKPLIEHILMNLRNRGFKDIIINLHHRPETITDYFGDGHSLGLKIAYSFEPRILGTAGAVKKVESQLTERFLVVYGDNLCNADYHRMVDWHGLKQGLATIALTSGDPTSGGVVKVGKGQIITAFLEKPPPDRIFSPWINAGIYVMEPAVVKLIPEDAFFDFGHDLFPRLLKTGHKLYGLKLAETLRGINTPEEYSEAQREYKRMISNTQ